MTTTATNGFARGDARERANGNGDRRVLAERVPKLEESHGFIGKVNHITENHSSLKSQKKSLAGSYN